MNEILFLAIAFINAFVDIGHKITLQNVVFKEFVGSEQIVLMAILNAMIIIPFVLFFSPSGFLSDKFPKNKIIKYGAAAAIILTILITICYYNNLFWSAFILTLLLGVQSAFYGPAKLGYIRELVSKEKISSLNAWLQSVSMIGILISMGVYSFIFQSIYNNSLNSLYLIGVSLVVLSCVEFLFSLSLPTLKETQNITFNKKDYISGKLLKNSFKDFISNKTIILSMVGLSVFWLIMQLMAVSFPSFAQSLNINSVVEVNAILATTGIGIFIGSLLYSYYSKNYIETGTIPVGALGLVVSLYLIINVDNTNMLFMYFLMAGISGGLFVVPLNSLIQFHAKEDQLGNTMAGSNWIQSAIMLLGLIGTTILALNNIDQSILMPIILFIAIIGTLYTIYEIPQSLLQFVIKFVFNFKYKLFVHGLNNLKSNGAILLLGNHVSWIDWAIIQMASPRRIKFLMDKSIYNKWYLRRFLDLLGVIPISGANKDSLKKIASYLDNGEVVCIFPEGLITRNGHLSEFKKGFEKILEMTTNRESVTVIPFYISGLWGDQFSRASQILKNNWKTRDITILFGNEVVNPNSDNVKKAVFNLSTKVWLLDNEKRTSLGFEIFNNLIKSKREFIVKDSTGIELNGKKLLTAAIAFKNILNIKSQNVGVILPSTAAGMIINLALLFKGKTLVNLNYTASIESLKATIKKAGIDTIITSDKFLNKLKAKNMDLTELFDSINVIKLEEVKDQISQKDKLFILLKLYLLPNFLLKIIYLKKVLKTDTAIILFSSGSEGTPKGVELSHENIIGNIKQITNILNPREEDSILGILPIFHAFGITVTTLLPVLEDIPVVCHPDPTDSKEIGSLVAKNKVTIMAATSTFLRIYTANKKINALMFDSLRLVIAGAEKLDSNVRKDFKEKFGKDIFEGYGATETSPVASVNIPNILTPDLTIQEGFKLGSVGMPIPGTSFKIVEPIEIERFRKEADKLNELNTLEEGMILISGPQIMKGYLLEPEKTKEVILVEDNRKWYITGDKGRLDSDGFLTIVDRYSRFAKLGGEMISLTAVEEEIGKCIKDIEYIAISAPDAKKGEKIIMVYQGELNENETKQLFVKSFQNNLMIPSELFKVDILPKLGTGKKDFKKAKELYLK